MHFTIEKEHTIFNVCWPIQKCGYMTFRYRKRANCVTVIETRRLKMVSANRVRILAKAAYICLDLEERYKSISPNNLFHYLISSQNSMLNHSPTTTIKTLITVILVVKDQHSHDKINQQRFVCLKKGIFFVGLKSQSNVPDNLQ